MIVRDVNAFSTVRINTLSDNSPRGRKEIAAFQYFLFVKESDYGCNDFGCVTHGKAVKGRKGVDTNFGPKLVTIVTFCA
jgi:hypothetical protein